MGRVLSGIQPTGELHIGNYLGALRQWVDLQKDHQCFYCIVDMHALTVPGNPSRLSENILNTAATLLAIGVDPERSVLFVQSDVPEHAQLAWILDCHAYMGELRRMTQFKEKAGKQDAEAVNVGLFAYPVLMAADILLYDATHVPVGEDQKQHLELTRDIARRLNNFYGDLFKVPEPVIAKQGARIMALDDPSKKMSKSSTSRYGYITLSDAPDVVRAKIQSAVTDSGKEVLYDPDKKAAISNLLDIYSLVSGESISALQEQYAGKGYGQFKKDLGEVLVKFLAPIQKGIEYWRSNPGGLLTVLTRGAQHARDLASMKMKQVKSTIGLGLHAASVGRAMRAG